MTTPNTPGTQLGQILKNGNGAPSSPASTSPLSRVLASGRRGEDVDLPLIGPVRIELIGARDSQEIVAAIYRVMRDRDVPIAAFTAEDYEAEKALRTLAIGVVDRATRKPFGSLDEWERLDGFAVNAAWQAYCDVAIRLDPLSQPLTAAERDDLADAFKKKAASSLRAFGIAKVCAWLVSTDALQWISPTPRSSSSGSSSER